MASKESKQPDNKNWKNRKFFASLKHASNGIRTIVKEERNMRNHAALGVVPLFFGWYFRISPLEWIAVIFCIFLVIIMEFLNTIFETVVDMVTDYEYHPLAKKAKDIAAGAVLVAAVFSVIIAGIIFLPKFFNLYF